MDFVYIEYRSRREGVDLALFHKFSTRHGRWSQEHSVDLMILNIGRTWRIGARQDYIVAFHSPNSGLERIDEWERIFTSGAADDLIVTSRLANRIDTAGCYEPLLEPVVAEGGPYYVEFFDFAADGDRKDVSAFFEKRRDRQDGARLHLLVDRIGKLGPEPRGLAVWSVPGYGSAETIAVELNEVTDPVRLVSAGLYNDVGREIL